MEKHLPKTLSYLRVSTDHQDLEKDKFEVLNLAHQKDFGEVRFFEEVVTGKAPWKKRLIKNVIDGLQKQDRLIVPELSRLGRSMLEVMEILSVCTQKGVEVYSIRDHWELNSTIQSKIIAMVFAMAAEIERDLLSARVKEGFRARKAKGLPLGWRKGHLRGSRLDKYRIDIWALLLIGNTKNSVAKRFAMSWSWLNEWLKTREIKPADEEAIRERVEEYRRQAASGREPKVQAWEVINPEDGSISGIPDIYIDKMRGAALNARLDTLLENTDASKEYNKGFADKMRECIKKYDYEGIFKLLGIKIK